MRRKSFPAPFILVKAICINDRLTMNGECSKLKLGASHAALARRNPNVLISKPNH